MKLPIFKKIDSLYQTLNGLKPLKPEDQQRLDKKFRLEFNYNSNHIEGNTLTYGETELLLIFGKTEGKHELREYEEMKAHDAAYERIKEFALDKEHPLTEVEIKNLNKLLLVEPFYKEAVKPDGQNTRRLIKVGGYKEYSNSVRLQNGEMFHYASPTETPIKMGELIEWFRQEEDKNEMHPVALAALLHYKFVLIHPFDDGNGRISRLLMNYVLLKNDLPPIIIKTADKRNYLFALNQADTGNVEAFVEYIAEQLVWSLEINVAAARGNNIDELGDLDKKLFLLKQKLGEEGNALVKMKYSQQAIMDVLENSLFPLVLLWENKLTSFDPLFTSRRVNATFGDQRFRVETFVTLVTQTFQQLPDAKKKNLKEITFSVDMIGLRKLSSKGNMDGGKVRCVFFENTYELEWTNGTAKINKLYHQPLSESEVEQIVEDIGTWFYNNIETLIKSEA